MSKKVYLFIVILTATLLTGCVSSPEMLGVTQAEWGRYTPDQQQNLLGNYRIIKVLQEKQNATEGPKLSVKVYGGKMLMEPSVKEHNYKPIKFTIVKGSCVDNKVTALKDETQTTTLTACYIDKTLHLDPSSYDIDKAYGTIAIHSSPFWDDGFSYRGVNSDGYARMRRVVVEAVRQ